jgi:hypothetical protein
VATVFPAIAPVLDKFPGEKINTDDAREELSKAGVEIEGVVWVAEFGLDSGTSKQFILPSAEMRRLSEFLRNWNFHFGDWSEIPSFWFDSEDYSVCVNLNHVAYARFMFHSPGVEPAGPLSYEDICENAPKIQVWMKGRHKPLEFSAEPDEILAEDEDEEELEHGQLEELLIELDGNMADHGFVSFMDSDGEYVYLRVAEIVMIAVPQWILKPALLEDTEELDDESSGPEGDTSGTTVQ